MAVVVKYIVVRNGEEKMTFATKKEADAYDKMLDIADNLFEFLDKSELKLPEDQMEKISLLLAEKKDVVMPILRGINPKKQASAKPKTPAEKSGDAAPAPKPKTAKK
jgi:dsDNA-binding SOS-regulon protein